jgi:hypothetical protein
MGLLFSDAAATETLRPLLSVREQHIVQPSEKKCALIRYDILDGLRKLYDEVHDEGIRERALSLIESEEDIKCRKRHATLWKR